MSPALLPRLLPLLLALGASTCKHTASITDAPSEPEVAAAKPPAVDRRSTPAADPTHPLELVPSRARAMFMVRSPQRLAQAWERERFIGRFPTQYASVVAEMKKEVGHDLLDPAALAAIGVDPTAPVGVAMLSFHDEAAVFFGGSSNPQAMIDLFQRVAGKPLVPQKVGEAQLLRVDEELSLVLRHGMFAIVLVDRHRESTPDYAQEVARIDPAQSLAHSATMERAHAGLPHDTDAKALLDVAGIIHDETERSRRDEQQMIGESNRRLAEARQRGSSAEEIGRLQQDLQREQEFMTSRRRERQIGELLLSRTFGAIEGIGLAVDANDQGLRGRIHVALAPEAAFRELFVSSEQPPTAVAVVGDAPQLVLSGQLEVGVAIDLFAQAALAAGSSYAQINDAIRDELRVDLDRDLRPLLDGRATFVLTAGPPLDPKKRKVEVSETLGGILALGVSDEAKARAVLDAAVGKWPEQRFTPVPEIAGWTLTRSEWPQALHVGVVAGQLVMSSDLAALRRLRDGQAGPASTHLPDPEAWQRLTTGPGAARLAMHHRLPITLVFGFMRGFDSMDFPENPDHVLAGEFPEQDVFSIPRSAATVRLEKERDKALEVSVEISGRRRKEREIVAWNQAEAYGITAGVVRETETGLMLEGGHYVTGGLAGYVETIVAQAEGGESRPDPELARARKRQEAVTARLLAARRKEIQRAIDKAKPKP